MTKIRKFAYAALLAVTALNFSPTTASAQEPARGRFTLTHEVQWGNAKIPAGDYQFSFNVDSVAPVLSLSKVSGAPAGYMVLVPMTEEVNTSSASRILLETTSDGSYVTAMQLPAFGMTLHFRVLSRVAEKQVAKAGTTVAVFGQ